MECDSDLAAKLTGRRAAYFGIYVFVAEISEVNSQPAEKPGGASDDDNTPTTIAQGRCIDVMDSDLFDVDDLVKQ